MQITNDRLNCEKEHYQNLVSQSECMHYTKTNQVAKKKIGISIICMRNSHDGELCGQVKQKCTTQK